jgi:biotin operon repressor
MPYDSGNECWKVRLLGLDGHSRGLLKLAQKGHDQDGEENWEDCGKRRWPGKPRPQHFETLYQWDLSEGGLLYFILIHFDHEFTEDDYAQQVTPQHASVWLRDDGYELPNDLKAEGNGSNVNNISDAAGADRMAPLPQAQQEVWDLLENCALTGKEIASKVVGGPASDDSIRKRIEAIRKSGRKIDMQRGLGYYRSDAPPPERAGAQRESD